MIRSLFAIWCGKTVWQISRLLNVGAGGTWPGELALTIDPDILQNWGNQVKKGIILIAGTNGKTTTSLMVKTILEADGLKVVSNSSGANLLNGVVSALIQKSALTGKVQCDWAVLEVDENSLPQITAQITPDIIVCLNLFRDQLDRYGEVDVITEKWAKALALLKGKTAVILNCDDPQIAVLGKKVKGKTVYFGLNDLSQSKKNFEHATDSIFCPVCGNRLKFSAIYFSHLGWWQCPECGEKRPKPDFSQWHSPLPGLYNRYNTLAAVAVAKTAGIGDRRIKNALSKVSPAFGRQEEIIYRGKLLKLMLSKNPAGFNESLRTAIMLKARNLLLVLNDRIPDGRDISWVWDVDFEMIPPSARVTVAGDRAPDLGLRIKYAGLKNYSVESDLKKALIKASKKGDKLFVLPTYSAMLDLRKIISGKKIL